ncbi:hypothetical protein C8T65DRAFT_694711 [Cerioporus squamosus]|nr:hypothetical protein C8T65DRAFT_694711 [Cerioporus squamosus]
MSEFAAKSTIATELFEELCELKRSALDTKAQLEADLSDELDIQSHEELGDWKDRYLFDLFYTNEQYRSSTLAHLRSSARRARFCKPTKKLSHTLDSLVDAMCLSRGAVENLIGVYEQFTPKLGSSQQAFMKSETDWLRSRFDSLERMEGFLRLGTERTKAPLDVLMLPAAQFEGLLRPLTRIPPVISNAAVEPIYDELSQLCAERRETAEKISDTVVEAFVSWFDVKTPESEQRAILKRVSGWRQIIMDQVERQNEILISIKLFKERAAHAPSVLVTTTGKTFEVSDLLAAMRNYDDVMDEISDVYDRQLVVVQKAKVSLDEIGTLFSSIEWADNSKHT